MTTYLVKYLGGLGPSPRIALRDPTRALRFDQGEKSVRSMPAADALDLSRRSAFALVLTAEDVASRYGVDPGRLGELPLDRQDDAVVLTPASVVALRAAAAEPPAKRPKRSKGGDL